MQHIYISLVFVSLYFNIMYLQMLSHKTLVMLLGTNPNLSPDQQLPYNQPQVTFAYTKHMWMAGQRVAAFNQLHNFVQNYSLQSSSDDVSFEERRRLLAR